ncbi:MAG: hypothetical protein ACI4MP_14160 [Candidatus Ventricola sp.]
MSSIVAFAVVLPSILYFFTSVIQTLVTLKKLKESQKDEVWETATKLLCKTNEQADATDFAMLYNELKYFKAHPEWTIEKGSLRSVMMSDSENTTTGRSLEQTKASIELHE